MKFALLIFGLIFNLPTQSRRFETRLIEIIILIWGSVFDKLAKLYYRLSW